MLNPMDIEIFQEENSKYAVVMAIAKRAREIANDPDFAEEIMLEKPVSLAIEDFKDGNYTIVSKD